MIAITGELNGEHMTLLIIVTKPAGRTALFKA
jgi:hypothetical protein